MSHYLDTRAVTDPVFTARWKVEVRLYGDVWSTVDDDLDVLEAAQLEAWLTGLTDKPAP